MIEREPDGNLYLALTPYHVLIAASHALAAAGAGGHELCILEEFGDAEALRRALGGWPATPFARVDLLARSATRAHPVPPFLRPPLNAAWLAHRARRRRYRAVHVCNDEAAESQALLAAAASRGSRKLCLEDGNAFYTSLPLRHVMGPVGRKIRRFLYAPWWRDLDYIGTHPAIDELVAVHPRLVSLEIRRAKPISRLDPVLFTADALRDLARLYAAEIGASADGLAELDVLVFPALSPYVADPASYGAVLRQVCAGARRQGLEVGVKLHPREPRDDPFGLEELARVRRLPRGLGAEWLYLLAGDCLSRVVGAASTALISARHMLPRARVVYLRELLGDVDERLAATLSALGVMTASGVGELEALWL